MRRDHEDPAEIDEGGRDRASEDAPSARHSGAPYRDRRDALVERRRALAREHADAARAAERRDKLVRHLDVIDAELREATAPMLEALEIARPCRARWEDMVGDDAVRRCGRCDREVHDLARMTRDEVHALFAHAERTPCVRLRRRADGRVITADCPVEPAGTAVRAMRVVAAGMLFGVSAAAGASLAMAPMLGRPTRGARVAAGPVHAALPARRDVSLGAPTIRIGALAHDTADPDDEDATLGEPTLVEDRAPITVADLDAHVRWLAPQAWEIDRALVDRALASSPLGGAPTLIPDDRGRVRVFGIRRASLLQRLGLENGDTLIDVNGYPLAEPDRALEAYARLHRSDSLFLRLERRGEERMHVYRIVQ